MEKTENESLVTQVKSQRKHVWTERIDDNVCAEGIARTDFDSLFVERGTIVCATQEFQGLEARDANDTGFYFLAFG